MEPLMNRELFETLGIRFAQDDNETAEENEMRGADDAPRLGTFFDEHIDLRDPEGTEFTAAVLKIIAATEARKRRLKTVDAESRHIRVRKLLANGLRCHFNFSPPRVLYSAKADAAHYQDRPSWMRHGALAEVVALMENSGLVATITGKAMPWNSKTRSWTSSYAVTDELIRVAATCGITPDSIEHRLSPHELVELRAPKPATKINWETGEIRRGGKGKPIPFEPTGETREWTEALQAINAFYRDQSIALGLSESELAAWMEMRNADPNRVGAPYRRPETFKTDIRRVFNNGDAANPTFDQGGRLFGGWWMSVPETLREAITINGQPTVEVDFKNCHPRMLYHEHRHDPDGDLYLVPEITAYEQKTGAEPGKYRPHVKLLMQVLINGKGRPGLAERPSDIEFPTDMPLSKFVRFIKSRHRPIADEFGRGAGLRLMRQESDIAMEIVTTAMAEGWTVLPVHDSFRTTVDRVEQLKAMMTDSYFRRFGFEPNLKESSGRE